MLPSSLRIFNMIKIQTESCLEQIGKKDTEKLMLPILKYE